MSDLLIKGVKMPQGCRQCHFKEWTNSRAGWFCPLRHKFLSMRVIIQDKRYGDCPLVEIPPHGRLIDSDKLVRHMEERQQRLNDDEALWELSVVDTFLSDAPTVIESEEE